MKYFKKSFASALLALLVTLTATAQVGIGTTTPAPTAQLEVSSTSKGFLPPRMTYSQRQNITTPATGLIVFCTDCGSGEMQFYNGTTWVAFASTTASMGTGGGGGTTTPTVTTSNPTSIQTTSASLSGTVTPTSTVVTASNTGFLYSTSPSATLEVNSGSASSTISDSYSQGTGQFSKSLFGLTAGTTYYVRAYVYHNSTTYVYGSTLSFTTTSAASLTVTTSTVSSTTNTTAVIVGTVTPTTNIMTHYTGFVYAASPAATLTVNSNTASSTISSSFSSANGEFSKTITGLTANTTYYTRGYASADMGSTYSYGNTVTFTTTNAATSTPTVTTNSAMTAMGCTSSKASLSGGVSSDGNSTILSAGFQYSTDQTFLTGTLSETYNPFGGGYTNMNSTISELTGSTTYYVRAYATNASGTGFGGTLSFTTATTTSATVSTNMPMPLSTPARIYMGGQVTCPGGSSVIATGFQYSTTNDNFISGVLTQTSSSYSSFSGSFNATISGVSTSTVYYIRSYVTTGIGTFYGNTVSTTTLSSRFSTGGSTGQEDHDIQTLIDQEYSISAHMDNIHSIYNLTLLPFANLISNTNKGSGTSSKIDIACLGDKKNRNLPVLLSTSNDTNQFADLHF